MTLQSILEDDRERFLRSLDGAATLADAGKCVQDECGRLLAIYNGETDSPEVRAAAQQMLHGCLTPQKPQSRISSFFFCHF